MAERDSCTHIAELEACHPTAHHNEPMGHSLSCLRATEPECTASGHTASVHSSTSVRSYLSTVVRPHQSTCLMERVQTFVLMTGFLRCNELPPARYSSSTALVVCVTSSLHQYKYSSSFCLHPLRIQQNS